MGWRLPWLAPVTPRRLFTSGFFDTWPRFSRRRAVPPPEIATGTGIYMFFCRVVAISSGAQWEYFRARALMSRICRERSNELILVNKACRGSHSSERLRDACGRERDTPPHLSRPRPLPRRGPGPGSRVASIEYGSREKKSQERAREIHVSTRGPKGREVSDLLIPPVPACCSPREDTGVCVSGPPPVASFAHRAPYQCSAVNGTGCCSDPHTCQRRMVCT